MQRINPDRFGDVLELGGAEIADREIKSPFHLTIGVLGEADRAGLANAFEARGDIDAVAHQIAVGLLDNVAQMNADAKLDQAPVTGALDDASVMRGDGGIDQIATQPAQPR